jgi:hypothetical protein
MSEIAQIVLPPSAIEVAKKQRALGVVLAISRATNTLTLVRGPLLHDAEDFSPQAARERFAALFLAAAVLYEALNSAEELGSDFVGKAWFDEGFGRLLADRAVSAFREGTLQRFRHKGVFHCDAGFFRKAVSRLPVEEHVVGIHASTTVADTYVSLSDDLLFDHLMGPFATDADKVLAWEAFMESLTDLMNEFLKASHRLIPAVLGDLGAFRRASV